MGSSKYKKIASTKSPNTASSSSRPKYYDEKIRPQKNKGSFPVIFIGIILVLGFGVFGIGKLIEFGTNPSPTGQTNENTFYQDNTGTFSDETGSSTYLTPISITDIDGNTYNLADYEGQVVILYFHFLDCSYCHYHAPNLAEAMGSFSNSQLLVLSISVNPADSVGDLLGWANDGGYTWPIIRDTDSSLASRFRAVSTPMTVYLDPTGAGTTQNGVQSTTDITTMINSLLS